MENEHVEKEVTEPEEMVEPEAVVEREEPAEEKDSLEGIYSNVASNRYENLRTSHIENKAKQLGNPKKKWTLV